MLKSQTEGTVTEPTLEGIYRVARKEDIDRGGLYDSRLGTINIWCFPGDRPGDYSYEIGRGALNYSHEYIATIMPRREGSKNYSIRLELQIEPERGGTEPSGRRVEPTRGDMEEVPVCLSCNEEVKAVLFNGFICHISNHLSVDSAEIGAEGNVILLTGRVTLSIRSHSEEGE